MNTTIKINTAILANTAPVQPSSNLLMMPNLDAANIAYQLIKIMADALPIGPILIGPDHPAHVLTPTVTTRATPQTGCPRRCVPSSATASRTTTSTTARRLATTTY